MTVRIASKEEVHDLNREMRGVDRETDVLSFPTASFRPGRTAGMDPARVRRQYDPSLGWCNLGDCVISLSRAREQAREYGHSLARELGYLTAHSAFHLMGYDHENETDRAAMRQMEERAMHRVSLSRTEEEPMTDQQLFDLACEAMHRAYTPYSGFKVGACLLSSDGRAFQGCNIENASYGATICAERSAVSRAVMEGARSFTAIAVVGSSAQAWPCASAARCSTSSPTICASSAASMGRTLRSFPSRSFCPIRSARNTSACRRTAMENKQSFRSGFVAILGRPNVGKSSIMNRFVGEKVAIVSNHPQTTRSRLLGVATHADWQIVFVDTPGLHKPRTKLGEYMVKAANDAREGVDAVLCVVDGQFIGAGDRAILEDVAQMSCPKFLAVNKIDLCEPEKLMPQLQKLNDLGFDQIVCVSARRGDNLDELLSMLVSAMPEGQSTSPTT